MKRRMLSKKEVTLDNIEKEGTEVDNLRGLRNMYGHAADTSDGGVVVYVPDVSVEFLKEENAEEEEEVKKGKKEAPLAGILLSSAAADLSDHYKTVSLQPLVAAMRNNHYWGAVVGIVQEEDNEGGTLIFIPNVTPVELGLEEE